MLSVSRYRASLSATTLPGYLASMSQGQTGIRCGLLDPPTFPLGTSLEAVAPKVKPV